jgi:hypothetical protein
MKDDSVGSYNNNCRLCGKAGKVYLGDGKTGETLCQGCFNRYMANRYDIDAPEYVPDRLSFKSRRKKPHEFDIEFMIFGTGKSLTATEIGETSRVVDVWGGMDDDFDEMMLLLKKRINKSLSVRYMGADGRIKDNKVAGYISCNYDRDSVDIIIDGKPYSWEELKRHVASREGWKIKIEFGSNGVDFD